jgi:ABC-type Fe3+-hydroxamate transport system substrate-binding protein
VPSQTELLASMGLDERVVGITKYCVHPAHWLDYKIIVGGTKNIDFEKIKQLQPDLIIANKEENIQEQVEALAQLCPVYVSDVNDLNSALEMILQVGLLVGTRMQAESLVQEIYLAFDEFGKSISSVETNAKTFAYLIWRKPYMVAGGDTFIHNMLQKSGLQNVFADQQRYPTVTVEHLQQAAPDFLMLSSEPYPFGQKHIEELQSHLPNTKIQLVDGEMFSWYGSRLLKAPAYFSTITRQMLF